MSEPLDDRIIAHLAASRDMAWARADKAEAGLAEARAYIAQLEDQDAAHAGRRAAGLDLTVEQRRERGLRDSPYAQITLDEKRALAAGLAAGRANAWRADQAEAALAEEIERADKAEVERDEWKARAEAAEVVIEKVRERMEKWRQERSEYPLDDPRASVAFITSRLCGEELEALLSEVTP